VGKGKRPKQGSPWRKGGMESGRGGHTHLAADPHRRFSNRAGIAYQRLLLEKSTIVIRHGFGFCNFPYLSKEIQIYPGLSKTNPILYGLSKKQIKSYMTFQKKYTSLFHFSVLCHLVRHIIVSITYVTTHNFKTMDLSRIIFIYFFIYYYSFLRFQMCAKSTNHSLVLATRV
jgi:hypothetical protein